MLINNHKVRKEDIKILNLLYDRFVEFCCNENCPRENIPYQNLFPVRHNRPHVCNKSCLFNWYGHLFVELDELRLVPFDEIIALPVIEEE